MAASLTGELVQDNIKEQAESSTVLLHAVQCSEDYQDMVVHHTEGSGLKQCLHHPLSWHPALGSLSHTAPCGVN